MRRSIRLATAALAVVAVGALLVGVSLAGAAAPSAGTADGGAASLSGIGGPVADGAVAQAGTESDPTDRQVRGSPVLELFASQRSVPAGAESTVRIDIVNTGEMEIGNQLNSRVTTARGLTLEIDDSDVPIDVEDGEIPVGDVPTSASPVPVELDVTVPDDVPDGRYEVEATARYRYTFEIIPEFNDHKDRRGIDDFDLTIVVDDGARFAVLETDTDAQVGGSGDVTATLRNVGDETARDAVVSGTTTSPGVRLGAGEGGGQSFVGDWAPGENRTVTFDSSVGEAFGGGAYALSSTVEYRDPNGIDETAAPARAGVVPLREQSFSLEDISGTLEVGYSGTVSGTITNEGPLDVENAVLVADSGSNRVSLGESRYALPTIPAGESANFSFDADVSGSADPGPRQFRFTTEYESGDATLATEESRRVEVAPRQPEFDLAVDGATVSAGETTRINATITNRRPETLSSINAGLYADSPLTAVNDEAFVDELEPGESEEIWFEVSAASSASVEEHPIELDFRYEDERGNDRISDITQVPVTVTEAVDDGGTPVGLIAVAALLVVAAIGGAVWYRRR
ncbi:MULTISPECIES: COG1361 S-layer family protein [Halorubrum]|uniref:COG1361 S-layer family protein n=1 Tax=Halorubrum ruber TaxID=2982524 RepID=A0A8T8LJI9_9EURY|nr:MULTISPECIES: COG1361 S-layer family protein [Halorubrum]QUO47000.1 COG1361 S-layer family protein [Halorubrum ruber]